MANMEDHDIIELYWARSQNAIGETDRKYGAYCRTVSCNILRNRQDSDECVNDTYWKTWESIPPQRPEHLRAFLGRIARNLSLDRLKYRSAAKRGGSETELALEELQDCVSNKDNVEQTLDAAELRRTIDSFLKQQPLQKRQLFMLRYWYLLSVREAAARLGLKENNARIILFRMRQELKAILEKEEIYV